MADTRKTKVRVSLSIEVDVDGWSATYSTQPTATAVRADVQAYIRNMVMYCEARDEAGLVLRG